MSTESREAERKLIIYAAGLSSILDLSGDDRDFRKLVQRCTDHGSDWEAIGSDFEAVGEDLQKAILMHFKELPDKKKVEAARNLISVMEEKKVMAKTAEKSL